MCVQHAPAYATCMILICFCIAVLLGIVVGDRVAPPMAPVVAGCAGLATLGLAWWPSRALRLALLLAATLLAGMLRIALAQPVTTAQSVWAYAGRMVVLEGVITYQPDRREQTQGVTVQAELLVIDGQTRVVHGLVLLQIAPVPELHYGERVQVSGELILPESSNSFDYRAYLRRKGIYVLAEYPKLDVIKRGEGHWWLQMALHLNDHARQTALHLLPEPHASLLVGVLLGVQSTLPPAVLDDFRTVGVTHILVISGWNITIIIVGIAAVLKRLGVTPRRIAAVSLPGIALYVLFVGPSPSVVRAALMGSLVVVATLVERESDAWIGLFVACAIMALFDPHVLWDLGFQLSALATAGMLAFGRPIQTVMATKPPFRWPGCGWMCEPFSTTLAASVLALPVSLYHFGNVSLIAPIANMLMLPVMPLAMSWGALATMCGMLWQPLGELVALIAWPFLQWMLDVTYWLARVPGASTRVNAFSAWWLVGYYTLIVVVRQTAPVLRYICAAQR